MNKMYFKLKNAKKCEQFKITYFNSLMFELYVYVYYT